MLIATWLLLGISILGAADTLFFHCLGHSLRSHAPARLELWTHAARGPTYFLLFLFVPNFKPEGAWLWALAVLLAIDLGISVADFSFEKKSRELLGGLSTGEYILHSLIAVLYGGFVCSLLYESAGSWNAPTQLSPADENLPLWLRGLFVVMALGVFGSGYLDARAARSLAR